MSTADVVPPPVVYEDENGTVRTWPPHGVPPRTLREQRIARVIAAHESLAFDAAHRGRQRDRRLLREAR